MLTHGFCRGGESEIAIVTEETVFAEDIYVLSYVFDEEIPVVFLPNSSHFIVFLVDLSTVHVLVIHSVIIAIRIPEWDLIFTLLGY